jgi:hypothetical protein
MRKMEDKIYESYLSVNILESLGLTAADFSPAVLEVPPADKPRLLGEVLIMKFKAGDVANMSHKAMNGLIWCLLDSTISRLALIESCLTSIVTSLGERIAPAAQRQIKVQ